LLKNGTIKLGKMTLKERYAKVIDYFSMHQPDAKTELHYSSAYQLLVAVILSAQCTDKRVNMITPEFFKQFPEPSTLALASKDEVFELIKSCSYPNNKTRNLLGMAKVLTDKFGGEVPDNVEDLQQLPGVGRKTANVVASVIYKLPAMAVDTHVFRVAARIGLTRGAKNPLDAEKQLVKHIPPEKIHMAHHWLILHGRYICQARKPKCQKCGISEYCRFFVSGKTGKI
jgi:endonuclease-3